jgi:hypothetical protein
LASISISDTLSAISNDKSLVLFNTIALSSGNTDILIAKLDITRKQYYSRMSELMNAGLIIRRNGKYFLTSYGKVVYEAQILIGKANENYWKLKAFDSIKSSGHDMRAEELIRVIDTLILDNDLKEILSCNKSKNQNQRLVVLPQSLSSSGIY